MMIHPMFIGGPVIPLTTSHGGLNSILLKRRKTCFGANKTKPGTFDLCRPMTNGVEPYTAPNTMKRLRARYE